jgi:ferredoxin-NADP reductase
VTPAPGASGRDMTVAGIRRVADRLVEVLLQPADGAPLPRWAPGAHVDLVLATGLTRPYSLAGDPDDVRSWRLLVAHGSPAGASAYVHERLCPGDAVRVRGPRHLFALGGGSRFLFLASGAGIAPLLPMARLVRSARVYPWSLVHVDDSSSHLALHEEVHALGDEARSLTTHAAALREVGALPPGTAVYAAGSSRFVDAVAEVAGPDVDVHRQRFDAPSLSPGVGRPYEVVLARRGERLRVEPGANLLTSLRDAGADVPVSCGGGICGACVLPVLEGAVAHRDSVLSASERSDGRLIVSCVSTAAGDRLVLDL